MGLTHSHWRADCDILVTTMAGNTPFLTANLKKLVEFQQLGQDGLQAAWHAAEMQVGWGVDPTETPGSHCLSTLLFSNSHCLFWLWAARPCGDQGTSGREEGFERHRVSDETGQSKHNQNMELRVGRAWQISG